MRTCKGAGVRATAVGAAALALVVAVQGAGLANAAPSDHPQHVIPQKGTHRRATANLVDHGGGVLPASHTYAIWWGSPSAFPTDAHTEIPALLSGLAGPTYTGIASQYMPSSRATSSYVAAATDTSAPPSRSPATATIVDEVGRVIAANAANGWSPDPTAMYFVYTSTFPSHVNYCAWHSYGTVGGTTVQVAYMPNTAGIAGCDPGAVYDTTHYTEGTRSLANVTAHEFMEAITDPTLTAWYDPSGQEIGDKCAWQFSGTVSLGGRGWQLQQEWSNSATGCVQT
ncbi:MAG: hypothetical protein JWO37_1903 [Acidimicrobiales bacterium]|jgi:hypothetical protein|nr:hypothetical protein [Acidimicrobiales bacterium]